MLQRIEHANGVVTYQSRLLGATGVLHAFTTRIGGISQGIFASLNLGSLAKDSATDPNTHVAENFRRLRAALGCPHHLRMAARQVHGNAVWVTGNRPVKPADAPEADAIVTKHPRTLLTIRTADCVPILLAHESGRVVAAVHAGWRGVLGQVVKTAVDTMSERFELTPSQLLAAIGPCISLPHFEVGPEVSCGFEAASLDQVIDRNRARPHIDLPRAVQLQLHAAGLLPQQIDTTDRCSFHHEQEFFSHRRDKSPTGRMAAVIAVR